MKASFSDLWIITYRTKDSTSMYCYSPYTTPSTECVYLTKEDAQKEVEELNKSDNKIVFQVISLDDFISQVKDDCYSNGQFSERNNDGY